MNMLMLSFFSWWYGQGWKQVAGSLRPRIVGVLEAFSVVQLLRTLFAPWRRIITPSGTSIDEKFKAWGDNVFSRCVGFVVRLIVLIAAMLSVAAVVLLTIGEILVWPLLPLGVPAGLIGGLVL